MTVLEKLGGWFILIVGGGILVLGGLLVFGLVMKGATTVHATAERPTMAAPSGPAAPPPPTPLEEVMSAESLHDAYHRAKPYVSDSVGEVSPGSAMLALWMAKHGSWKDVSTSFAYLTVKRIKKDVNAARGLVTCIRGTIAQISRDPTADRLFVGTLATDQFDFVHYFAGGDTGSLVDGDRARFCGVVTGIFSYPNLAGGQTQAVQLVGMFDL